MDEVRTFYRMLGLKLWGCRLLKKAGLLMTVRTGWCDSYSKRSRSDSPRILRLMRRRSEAGTYLPPLYSVGGWQ